MTNANIELPEGGASDRQWSSIGSAELTASESHAVNADAGATRVEPPSTSSAATETAAASSDADTETQAEPARTPVDIFELTLGGPDDPDHGSAASIVRREVFLASTGQAKANADDVDLIYYVGAREEALYSPSQSDVRDDLPWLEDWSAYRNTKLRRSGLTAAAFDNISYSVDIPDASPVGDVVERLEVNNVLEFEIESGKTRCDEGEEPSPRESWTCYVNDQDGAQLRNQCELGNCACEFRPFR